MSDAVKHDGAKIRPELVDPAFILGVAAVSTMGARKYAAGNWLGGMDWSRFYGAALRHLLAWYAGQDTDPESGLPHLHHAAWSLMALAAYQRQGLGGDDRGAATPLEADISTTMTDVSEG